jgi:signal transduction histidine kinase
LPVIGTSSIGTGREAVVSVRDEGEGIHPADQHRVFERFYRAAETQARQTGGAGLGLYIAQRLVVPWAVVSGSSRRRGTARRSPSAFHWHLFRPPRKQQ